MAKRTLEVIEELFEDEYDDEPIMEGSDYEFDSDDDEVEMNKDKFYDNLTDIYSAPMITSNTIPITPLSPSISSSSNTVSTCTSIVSEVTSTCFNPVLTHTLST